MTSDPIPAEIRRFILTSIASVPHLEALRLLRADPRKDWDAAMMAHTLYLSDKMAAAVLADLATAGFVAAHDQTPPWYRYQPSTPDLKDKIDYLVQVYAQHLVEVTNLIHSKTSKQAQQFGDAFKWPGGKA